ncbi:MAG: glycosyltransferase family 4 protein [Tepidisphaeraceae bacterium]
MARKDALGGGTLLKLKSVGQAIAFVWRVRRYIRRLKPALVHTNSLKADILGGLAARAAAVPVIWHVRDRITDDYLPPRVVKVFKFLARRVPTFIVANSQSTLATLGGVARGDTVPSGLADEQWQEALALDQKNDFPTDAARPLIIGLLGRITRWKGQHVFIDAARLLRDRYPDCRFRIIGSALFGEDDYEREIRDAVRQHGLEQTVEFTGFRADVINAIGELDVLVHASITGEPFGQVIVEGMAAGKPVVATRGGGVPEIVVDDVTGLLVPMGDAAAMAAAIDRLLADATLRKTMGLAGRQRVADHFMIRHTAEKIQRVYDELLGKPKAGNA